MVRNAIGSKYGALFESLKDDILGGKYMPGSSFPSERALISRYKLSRNTVQHALRELTKQGFLESRRGAGTFVTRHGASRKIGLMVPGTAYSEFFQPIVGAISRQAQQCGYTLLLGNIAASGPKRRVDQAKTFARELVRENVAGVICQPVEFVQDAIRANREVMAIFDKAGIPVVLIDYDIVPPPERSKYDLVGINNYYAGAQLARHLQAVGARSIDFVMRPGCSWSVYGRRDGVLAAAQTSGKARARVLVAEPDDLAALKRHLRRGRPDAFVCGNDTVAAKFKQTLEKAGLFVPRDVLLAGFDDLQIAALLTPPLTTIRQPCDEIGEMAFRELLARMQEPAAQPRETFLAAALVVRESTGAGMRKGGDGFGKEGKV